MMMMMMMMMMMIMMMMMLRMRNLNKRPQTRHDNLLWPNNYNRYSGKVSKFWTQCEMFGQVVRC